MMRPLGAVAPPRIVELVLSEPCRFAPEPHTELAQVARSLGAGEPRWPGPTQSLDQRTPANPYLAFQHELCISCGRCVRACDEVQGAFRVDRDR